MKRIVLSAAIFAAAAASAITMAAGSAQAIPAFSRQTGAACLHCHFQSFPALSVAGRAFKRRAFTDVGEQALLEDDNLSIPAVLNASLLLSADYTDTKTTGVAAAAPGYSNGTWNLPAAAPLLIAGRVGRHVGAYGEFGGGAGAANGQAVDNWQVMSSFDVDGISVGLNAFNTKFGWTAGLEASNVFGQNSAVADGGEVSAVQNVGMVDFNTQGLTLWAGNDLWLVGVSGVSPDISSLGATNVGTAMIPGIRAMVTPQVMDWDTMIGAGLLNGTAGGAGPGGVKVAGADMWFIDAQAQGEIGEETLVGVYADYAHTRAKANVTYNIYGADPLAFDPATGQFVPGSGTTAVSGETTDGWSIRAVVKTLDFLILGAGYGQTTFKPVAAASEKNSIWNASATYELYQNAELKLVYSERKLDPNYPTNTLLGAGSQTIRTTKFMLEALM